MQNLNSSGRVIAYTRFQGNTFYLLISFLSILIYYLKKRIDFIMSEQAGGLGVACFELRHDVFGNENYQSSDDVFSIIYEISRHMEETYGLKF